MPEIILNDDETRLLIFIGFHPTIAWCNHASNFRLFQDLILYRMGQIEDAEWQADQLLSLHPEFDPQIWEERQPFSEKQTVDKMLEDLKQVGLTG